MGLFNWLKKEQKLTREEFQTKLERMKELRREYERLEKEITPASNSKRVEAASSLLLRVFCFFVSIAFLVWSVFSFSTTGRASFIFIIALWSFVVILNTVALVGSLKQKGKKN